MNADELDAAREAVSATRTWRDQMRADWGTSFREPEEVLDEAVGELLAERDRLRAVVDAQRDAIHARNCYITADTDEERDAASRAMDETRQRLLALDVSPDTGERDRLRAVADAAQRWADAKAVNAIAALTSNPDHGIDELERSEAILLAALREIGEPPE